MPQRTFDATIFDLDGVVTQTAAVHAAAWEKLFNDYLRARSEEEGKPMEENYRPFDTGEDYRRYVDGKPRYEGVKSFLESRGIQLSYGDPGDAPGTETYTGLGNRKNQLFRKIIEEEGVTVFSSTVELIQQLREEGVQTAVVSSSKNCAHILETAKLSHLFDVRVDGIVSAELGLEGKPAPDIFLKAAEMLGVSPERSVVVEDAISGVEAGKRGGFAFVVGVDRTGHPEALREHGADIVVGDLGELSLEEDLRTTADIPSALDHQDEIQRRIGTREPAVFLDYDGTLTPIVDRPEDAVIPPDMKEAVRSLARVVTVAVVSGRDREDVQNLVGLDEIYYAGSHGFDIAGPQGAHIENDMGSDFLPALDEAEAELRGSTNSISGVLLERKRFSIAVHYRLVSGEDAARVEEEVKRVAALHPELRRGYGKMVYELQPRIDWHKGKAVNWLLKALALDLTRYLPIYVGDDITDEDAFRTLRDKGIGVVVRDAKRPTGAQFALEDVQDVRTFLGILTEYQQGGRGQ